MGTLNYTTTIAVTKTMGEIQGLLVGHGARTVTAQYDDGRAVGVSFSVLTPHGPRDFALPVDVEAMRRLLAEQERSGKLAAASSRRKGYYSEPAQAERVAWRVVKDWLAAQLALVEARMASLDQVMLPYLVVDSSGKTLYGAYAERERATIEAATT